MRFTGKAAIVTGGGTGIGAAVARRLRSEGAEVIVMGRRPAPLEAVAKETGAIACAGDAALPEDCHGAVELAVERFGGLDIVIPNAGSSIRGAGHELDDAGWRESIHANLDSAFFLCRAALPELIRRRGTIVIVSSMAAHTAGPGMVGYVTTKHALTGLTISLARDYGRHGVRVNAVCPGWVRTPMADPAMDFVASVRGTTREGAYRLLTSDVPLGRPGEPEEVASICAFLASSEASLITGGVLLADGGAHVVDLGTLELGKLGPRAEAEAQLP